MKKNHFFANVNIWLVGVSLLLSSCEKAPEMNVTSEELVIEATQTEAVTFDISSNVFWTIKTIQDELWITVHPTEGKGNATITVQALENIEFTERKAFIVISGEGVITDTVKIIQAPSLDIAEKITDAIFKQYCLDEFDRSPKDGRISAKEALTITKIVVKGMKINSLAGVEYFTRLTHLYCSVNNIDEIDVSRNKEIKILDCSYNPNLKEIDVSNLSRLQDLFIHNTEIQTVDVSKNLELLQLNTSNSPISSIDVTKNKKLTILLCNDNQLTDLDLTQNTALLMLSCGNNKLKELNLSMNTNLVNLWCNNQTDGNQKLLKHIDISKNIALQTFSCGQNGISNLDVTNNTDLVQLRCDENQLTELDIRENIKITELKCNNNKLKDVIDISNNKSLKSIDLRKNPSLTTIQVWKGFDAGNSYYEKDSSARYVVKQ